MMLVELTTVPTVALPVAEFASHLHLGTGFANDGAQNPVLEIYLRAAMAAIEARIGKALMTRNFAWQLTAWRDGCVQGLPVAPVQTILALKMTDLAGVVMVIPASQYYLEKDSQQPRLRSVGASLPAIPAGGVVDVEFSAGFGPGWSDVPVDLAQAVYLLAAHYYENRRSEGSRKDLMPFGVMALIENHRAVRLLGGRA
ncbi:MAG: hypothetical protein GXP05_09330 [Alphaproteobacteria bacterium]|nr:hypothetical protein [Alphaproteobacteria bacterium]